MTEAPVLASTQLGHAGPRIAFLHGLFGQGRNWTGVAKGLSADARVTLLDLPDHGRSPWSTSFSYEAYAAQVAATLRRVTAGDDRWTIVGHSMGGKVAMVLALQHSELLERLVVVDVSPVLSTEIKAFGVYVEALRAIDLDTLVDRAHADAELGPAVPDERVRGFLLQNLRREHVAGGGSRWRWQINLDLLGDRLDDIAAWPDLDRSYDGPVLWLAGGRSRYVQPAYAPAMRALFPRVRLVTVKTAGHWVHSDSPDVVVTTLRRFAHLG